MNPTQLDVHEFARSPAVDPAGGASRTILFSPFPGICATYEEEPARPLARSDLIAFAIACVLICSLLLLR